MRAELYGCIKDEDECQNGAHNCSVNEQCINTFGSFNCTCLQGYSEDGVQCSEPLPCHKSLGMEDGGVSGGQISASSELSPNHAAVQGRLNFLKSGVKEGAWTAGSNNGNQWLQIYLGNQTLITGVATQGRSGACHWVTKYNLQYSDYGVNFAYYTEHDRSSKKEFVGNTDQNTIVYHELKPPIRARYIRFRPVAWYVGVSMRVELYGCFQECIGPLGMEDGVLSDDKITASTEHNGHHAIQGRLHFPASNLAGAWVASTTNINQWLQIYLGNRFANITGVATQGRDQVAYWVKTYNLQYGNDELSLQYYSEQGQSAIKTFDGNTDWKSIVYHELQPPVKARFIRIRPVSWHGQITMRAELYGCIKDEDECQNGAHNCSVNEQCINTFGSFNCTCLQGYSEDGVQCSEPLPCHKSLGMEDGGVSGGQISASSELSPNHAAVQGRLNFLKSGVKEGAWTAGSNDGNQWLQIYLGNQTLITGVATQGRSGACHWVTKYNLQYSDYGENFAYYTEQDRSSKKEFVGNTDQNTIVYHELKPPIRARYIRFRPVAWYVGVSMRVELYGCFQECIGPLGMEDGVLSDDKITASTEYDGHHAIQGRLHFPASNLAGAWTATRNDINQWLQIYLGNRFANITGVATQGRDQVAYWVKTYNLQYGNDELSLQYYSEQGQSAIKTFDGNTDWKSIVYHELQPPVIARFIRIRPVSWHGQITMRVELYGCIEDEDECQNGAHNCSVNEQCINTFGSFNCTCLQGYSEDGVQCSGLGELL
ncbi:uncharacterized protein LOC144640668 [Oculina patagonica]